MALSILSEKLFKYLIIKSDLFIKTNPEKNILRNIER